MLRLFLPDTCYVLSFSIIMLNTSLHNPSVKDKPSVEQFITMNRGIDNGGDLPQDLLVVSISTSSLSLTFSHPVSHQLIFIVNYLLLRFLLMYSGSGLSTDVLS